MKIILRNKWLSLIIIKKVLKCIIEHVLQYSNNCCNKNERIRKHIVAWVSWTARRINNDRIEKANESRTLYATLRKKRYLQIFFGHRNRRDPTGNIATIAEIVVEMTEVSEIIMFNGLSWRYVGPPYIQLTQKVGNRDCLRDNSWLGRWRCGDDLWPLWTYFALYFNGFPSNWYFSRT